MAQPARHSRRGHRNAGGGLAHATCRAVSHRPLAYGKTPGSSTGFEMASDLSTTILTGALLLIGVLIRAGATISVQRNSARLSQLRFPPRAIKRNGLRSRLALWVTLKSFSICEHNSTLERRARAFLTFEAWSSRYG
jgi:hypothetical protein